MEIFEPNREGTILRIERSSIHDGDGFRTVVFLKGCPLRCQWCSTPESQSFEIERTDAYSYGEKMTVAHVLREARKDSHFYFISSGGVTLSGGEALAQPEFSLALLKNFKAECFNTAIETSFFAPWEKIDALLPYTDTAYVDLKLYTKERHQRYCGVENTRILENMTRTNDVKGRLRLVIRTPIIPGVNDDEEELKKIGAFCAGLRNLHHVQLLPYHRLGTATYEKLGLNYPLKGVLPPSAEQMEYCRGVIGHFVERVI